MDGTSNLVRSVRGELSSAEMASRGCWRIGIVDLEWFLLACSLYWTNMVISTSRMQDHDCHAIITYYQQYKPKGAERGPNNALFVYLEFDISLLRKPLVGVVCLALFACLLLSAYLTTSYIDAS